MEKVATIGQRLRQVMQERELSYEQFGRLLDMRPQTLNRYVLGQREPKAEAAMEMALQLGVNLYWLQGYDVPPEPEADQPGDPEHPVLPILGVIKAGIPTLAAQEILGYAAANSGDQGCFFLRVSGDSMQGAGIQDGDLVLIRPQPNAQNGQIVACMVGEEDATLKRFRQQGDMILLQPENPAYEPRLIPASDFRQGSARIVGVATKLVREL
jgi:repressor LexA